MKKLISLVLIAMLLLLCMASCGVTPDTTLTKEDAVAVFTLDVNPGMRVYVAEDDTVIEVEATNEDGEAVLEKMDVKSLNYKEVVETIIDKLTEEGYLEAEESAVLVSVEKQVKDISDALTEKIHGAFEKHNKRASIIKQELVALDEDARHKAEDIAEKHGISEGKAHFIDKIRDEFPTLDEEELAGLNMSDLGVILDQASEDIKGHFVRVDEAPKNEYITKEAALAAALTAAEVTEDSIRMERVSISRCEGSMVYEVRFVCEDTEYKVVVDAVSAEVLKSETKEHTEIVPDEVIKDFCDKYNIGEDKVNDHFFGYGEEPKVNPLTRSKIIKVLLDALKIGKMDISEINIKLYEDESGKLYSVTITQGEDVYEIIAEACTGTLISVQKNGEDVVFDVGVDGDCKEEGHHKGDNHNKGDKDEWDDDKRHEHSDKPETDDVGDSTEAEDDTIIEEGTEAEDDTNTEGNTSTDDTTETEQENGTAGEDGALTDTTDSE